MFQTLQENGQYAYSKIEDFISHRVGSLSKIISMYESKEILSRESGVILTPEGEKLVGVLLSELI